MTDERTDFPMNDEVQGSQPDDADDVMPGSLPAESIPAANTTGTAPTGAAPTSETPASGTPTSGAATYEDRLERLGGEPAPVITPEEFARLQKAGQVHIDERGRVRTARREDEDGGVSLKKRRAWYAKATSL